MKVKIINRELAIGNIILELLQLGKTTIEIDEILSYESEINKKLHDCEYRVLLGWNNVDDFTFDYPYLCSRVNENIALDANKRKDLLHKYDCYFRIGAPQIFVTAVREAVTERYKEKGL